VPALPSFSRLSVACPPRLPAPAGTKPLPTAEPLPTAPLRCRRPALPGVPPLATPPGVRSGLGRARRVHKGRGGVLPRTGAHGGPGSQLGPTPRRGLSYQAPYALAGPKPFFPLWHRQHPGRPAGHLVCNHFQSFLWTLDGHNATLCQQRAPRPAFFCFPLSCCMAVRLQDGNARRTNESFCGGRLVRYREWCGFSNTPRVPKATLCSRWTLWRCPSGSTVAPAARAAPNAAPSTWLIPIIRSTGAVMRPSSKPIEPCGMTSDTLSPESSSAAHWRQPLLSTPAPLTRHPFGSPPGPPTERSTQPPTKTSLRALAPAPLPLHPPLPPLLRTTTSRCVEPVARYRFDHPSK